MRLPHEIFQDRRALENLAAGSVRVAGPVGVACLVAAVLLALVSGAAKERFFHSYLTSYSYFLSISLGALFFVLLQHLTRAGWSVVIRRLAEVIAANVWLLAILLLPVLVFGLGDLYPWTDGEAVSRDALLQGKRAYLNVPFFLLRLAVYFAAWGLTARYFLNRSVEQDRTGDLEITLRMERRSAPAMVLYAFTVTFAAFDLLMSLDPHWYSTIFGVYFFAGGLVGFFALLPVVSRITQKAGRMEHMITPEHYHDMGKLIFAFVIFWAYIAFSQYMLIWYGNIPEETTWFLRRQEGGWGMVALLLLVGHFVVPFLGLISSFPKRRRNVLSLAAAWVLLMHYVDLYWLVMPEAGLSRALFHPLDALLFIGMAGLSVALAGRRLQKRSLIPEKDPRLEESIAFENA